MLSSDARCRYIGIPYGDRYTSSVRDTRSKVEYDLYYVKHCSLMMDLAIMVRTVKVVLAMKGQ